MFNTNLIIFFITNLRTDQIQTSDSFQSQMWSTNKTKSRKSSFIGMTGTFLITVGLMGSFKLAYFRTKLKRFILRKLHVRQLRMYIKKIKQRELLHKKWRNFKFFPLDWIQARLQKCSRNDCFHSRTSQKVQSEQTKPWPRLFHFSAHTPER